MYRVLIFIIVLQAFATLTSLAQEMQQTRENEKTISSYTIVRALDAKLVANFPLDEDFLLKIENIRRDIANLPIEEENADADNDITIKGLTRAVETHPNLMALLEKHHMTASDYVVGAMALSSVLTALAEEDVTEFDETSNVSPANLAFGKRHLERIRALYAP